MFTTTTKAAAVAIAAAASIVIASPSMAHAQSIPAPRLSGHGQLLEDESPYVGAHGGRLVSFDGSGVASYDDGTCTDGAEWYDCDDTSDDTVE